MFFKLISDNTQCLYPNYTTQSYTGFHFPQHCAAKLKIFVTRYAFRPLKTILQNQTAIVQEVT